MKSFRNRLLSLFLLLLVNRLDVVSSQTACTDCAACLASGITHVLISSDINAANFQECTTINEVTFASTVTIIPDNCFEEASSLTKINFSGTFSSGLTIGSGAFTGTVLAGSLLLPSGLTSIKSSAFHGLSLLTSVTIPDTTTFIGDTAFYKATALVTVTFSGTYGGLIIGSGAFQKTALTGSLMLPVGLTSIGDGAFSDVTLLTSVTIPNSVTFIGVSAFYRSTALTTVTFSGTFSGLTIGKTVFMDTALTGSLVLPAGLTSIGDGAFQQVMLTSVTIPDSVTFISNSAFYKATLTTVTFSGSFQTLTIDTAAFFGTALTGSLVLPAGLKTIGINAFKDVKLLTSVTIPSSVTSIGNNAFNGATGLSTVVFSGTFSMLSIGSGSFQKTALTGPLTLPAGLTSIGKNAFAGLTLLTDLTIPDSVITIGDTAFQGSGSSAGSCLIWDSSVTRSIGTDVFVPNYINDCLSQVPSALPTVVPPFTPEPSPLPSVTPSVEPTFAPSPEPSPLSSVTPSMGPTFSLSPEPSLSPSVAPSATPIMKPSRTPSRMPTIRPSRQPTAKPTITPTVAPSVGFSGVVVSAEVIIENVHIDNSTTVIRDSRRLAEAGSNVLRKESDEAIIKTVVEVLGLSDDAVSIESERIVSHTENVANVSVVFRFLVSAHGFPSYDACFTNFTDKMDMSVANGRVYANLLVVAEDIGAYELYQITAVTVASVINEGAVDTFIPAYKDGDDLSAGYFAGVLIGVIAAFLACFALMYFCISACTGGNEVVQSGSAGLQVSDIKV